jgi:peptidyl-tRNA hydrolase
MNPVIYIFLNKSLQMSVGKAAAQAAHAIAMLRPTKEGADTWESSPHRTIIVLEARNEQHMKNIRAYLHERQVSTTRIIDEGANEIDPHTWTALATCILDKDAEYVQKTMSTFKLYRDTIKINLEVSR